MSDPNLEAINEAKYDAQTLRAKLERWREEGSHYKTYALCEDLIAEVDELRAKLDQVRSEIGCARGQRTTQFCAEAAELQRRLDAVCKMFLPEPDDYGNEPFYCEGCGWMGFDIVTSGDNPENEYVACPECGDGVEETSKYNRDFLAAVHARAVAIADGRDNG